MSRVPTMMIETDNGPVVINRSAFDPATMTAHGAEAEPAATDPEAEPAATDPEAEPAATDPEAEQPKTTAPAGQQMLVTKKGKKFLVVDDKAAPIERDGIDASGYATEADAWAAIMALQG